MPGVPTLKTSQVFHVGSVTAVAVFALEVSSFRVLSWLFKTMKTWQQNHRTCFTGESLYLSGMVYMNLWWTSWNGSASSWSALFFMKVGALASTIPIHSVGVDRGVTGTIPPLTHNTLIISVSTGFFVSGTWQLLYSFRRQSGCG